ncbi:MAG: osmotically inducible protein OsmC [Ignavibacteria bacterium GWA2_35_9]|nr:MAG: osmotically inducible protein OsmC [Ignavibacteria bacterium GWA2_35_9]OGU52770.1 MAG: osmotically inducible protein OsmC [Ignavibacteria bacterium GWC2_36_12]
MDNVHFYNTDIKWEQGRRGTLTSPVLSTPITVATPPEFSKGEPNVWSPEHLYVAAANGCLMTTFLAIAENSRLDFISFNSTATGKLEKVDNMFMISEIELKPKVILRNEKDRERALRIIEKSEQACLISNSMKSKIVLSPEVIISE